MTYHFHSIAILLFITMANDKVPLANSFIYFLYVSIQCMNRILKLSAHEFGYAKLILCVRFVRNSRDCPPYFAWTFEERRRKEKNVRPQVGSPLEIGNRIRKIPLNSHVTTYWCWSQLPAWSREDFRFGQTFEVPFLEFNWKIRNLAKNRNKVNIYMLPIPKFGTWKFSSHGSTQRNSNYRHGERARWSRMAN